MRSIVHPSAGRPDSSVHMGSNGPVNDVTISCPHAAQAEVAALEEDIQALQRQLEQTELDCVYTKAQIATLARLTDSDAAAAPPVVSGPGAQLDAWSPPDPASRPPPDPERAARAAHSEVRTSCQRRALPACTP